jgi:hypothetical protein
MGLVYVAVANGHASSMPFSMRRAGPRPAVGPPIGAAPTVARRAFQRRDYQSADELSRQLFAAPELDLDAEAGTGARLALAGRGASVTFMHPVFEPLLKRADLQGLPIAMGADCQLGRESAVNLQGLSSELRVQLAQCLRDDAAGSRVNADALRQRLLEGGNNYWRQTDAVPTLVQMLQAEDRPVRLLLVELLRGIPGPAASAALAGRAVFDLSAEVREAAVGALADRPRDEYRGLLLDGLRYPWAPAADHAAEALAALNDRGAIPPLAELLAEPDPSAPSPRTVRDIDRAQVLTAAWLNGAWPLASVALDEHRGTARRTAFLPQPTDGVRPVKASAHEIYAVREVVRVNHLRNCLLCHAVATAATDPVRGLVPSPGQPLPPPSAARYYEGRNGTFVRADVTYLRQDFSVPQPVANSGSWPAHQRYDYVVRTRHPTDEELRRPAPKTYPQREAVRWALRELAALKDG